MLEYKIRSTTNGLIYIIVLLTLAIVANGSTQSTVSFKPTPSCTKDAWGPVYFNITFTGGVLHSAYNTLGSCQQHCINVPDCTGIDYNFTSNGCFVFRKEIDQSLNFTAINVNHYVLRRCPTKNQCTDSWMKLNNTHSLGGVQRTGISSLTGCQDSCARDALCLAIDFNTAAEPDTCWLYVDSEKLQQKYPIQGIDQYIISRCSPECNNTWTERVGVHSRGAEKIDNKSTLDSCQRYCIAYTECVGLDYNTADVPSTCWVYTNAKDMEVVAAIEKVNQYILQRCQLPTTTTLSTTALCVPEWSKLNNTHSSGGTLVDDRSTVTACQDYCLSQPSCVALDFNHNESPNTCWVYHNPDSIKGTAPILNIDQYIIVQRCSNVSTMSVVSTSIITLPLINQTICKTAWSFQNDTHSLGGEQNKNITTIESCQNFCIATPNCVAIDFNRLDTPMSCWYYTDSGKLSVTQHVNGIDQYVLSRCSSDLNLSSTVVTPGLTSSTVQQTTCTLTWSMYNNTHSLGADQNKNITTLDNCQSFCIGTANCVGIDFNKVDTPMSCWYYTDNGKLSARQSADGIDQYALIRCSSDSTLSSTITAPSFTTSTVQQTTCIPMWTILNDTHSLGADQNKNITTLDSCQSFCIATANCIGIDFNKLDTPMSCWYYTDNGKLSQKQNVDGINQYVLSRCSSDFSLSSTLTTPALTSSTVLQTTCMLTWTIYNDTHSLGAEQNKNITTLDNCQSFCIATANCVGIDFNKMDTPMSCWYYTDSAKLSPKQNVDGINQYVLVRCSSDSTLSSTITTPALITSSTVQQTTCKSTWTVNNNTHSLGAEQNKNVTILDNCQSFCISTPNCVGIDFNKVDTPMSCWYYTDNGKFSARQPADGIDQYTLTRC